MSAGLFTFIVFANLSLFAIGSSLWTIGSLIRRRPKRWYGFVGTRLSMGVVVGLLLSVVLPRATLTPGPLVYLYLAALATYSVSALIADSAVLDHSAGKALKEEILEHRNGSTAALEAEAEAKRLAILEAMDRDELT